MAQKIHFQNRIKKVSFCMNTSAVIFISRKSFGPEIYLVLLAVSIFKRHSCKIGQRKMQELFALFHAFLQHLDPCCWCTPNYACNLKKKWGALASLELHSLLQTRNKLVGRQHLVCRSGCGLFRHTKKICANLSCRVPPIKTMQRQKWGGLVMRW